MQRYFGRPYPFEKYDFVLAPAFPFGGMEHPGAVFYSEDGFIFRERPTLPRRLGRFSTILHEAAHQWFGDLVTMRWFDDLWLKEGFATFMAAKALAELEPGADAWKTFHLGNKPAAYAVDRTAGTRPLWQELENLDQAKSNYGAIVYNKAPSILKQLEYLVGEPAFREGVRRFLERHAYGNATWRDLLDAVGRAAGRPLDGFGRAFMLRAGMPVVTQRVELRGGRLARLTLTQRPAKTACELAATTGASPPPCPLRSAQGDKRKEETWTQRTELLLAYRDRPPARIPVELRGAVTEVPAASGLPPPDFVFANARDYGYSAAARLRQRARPGDRRSPRPRIRSSAPCCGVPCGTRCAAWRWSRSASCALPSASCPASGTSRSCRWCWGGSSVRSAPTCGPPRGNECRGKWNGCSGRAQRTRRDPTASARRTWMRSSASPPQPKVSQGSTRCWTPIRWPASRSATRPGGTPSPACSSLPLPRRSPATPPRRAATPRLAGADIRRGRGAANAGQQTWNRAADATLVGVTWAAWDRSAASTRRRR
jgi:hypothetical protein